jgi:hypothetical protein
VKTTIDIEDDLLKAAKKQAIDEGTTLKALVEEGLRERVSAKVRDTRTPVERLAALFAKLQAAADADSSPRGSELSTGGGREAIYAERIRHLEDVVDEFRSRRRV